MGNFDEKNDYNKKFKKKLVEAKEEKKKLDSKKSKKDFEKIKKERKDKKKYELNIYIYSNHIRNYHLIELLSDYNKDIFDWKIQIIENEFSKLNSGKLIEYFKKNYENEIFKDVLIIPINSFSEFENDIVINEKNILAHFESLIPEMQPFFLLIDSEEEDFVQNENSEVSLNKFLQLRRLEKDFEINIKFEIKKEEIDKIEAFKKLVLNKNENSDMFEIMIYNLNIYISVIRKEKINNFLEIFDNKNYDSFDISFVSITQNANFREEFESYKILDKNIREKKFRIFDFKEEKIKAILDRYSYLDPRNFKIIRERSSIKAELIKYTGYFNQFGNLLFNEQNSYYPGKINIAVGGSIGSGKSALINTILGEKRCLEGGGHSKTNHISEYTLKDYPLNFIDFPGFGAKQGDIDNTSLFVNAIKKKMEQMEQINEIIHCILLCIKYGERLLDNKDNSIKTVFDTIFEYEIKTFLIITQSEESNTKEFQNFKELLLTNINQITKNKDKKKISKVFGENFENQIIPIFAMKKKVFNNWVGPFGIDKLFNTLYIYFQSKRIYLPDSNNQFSLNSGDYENSGRDIQIFIDKYELLKIFVSKEKFIKGLREKMKDEINKIIIIYFLKIPKLVYKTVSDVMYECCNDILDSLLNIYKVSIEGENNIIIMIRKILEEITGNEETKIIEEGRMFDKEFDETKFPLPLRFTSPFLTPLYYFFGGIALIFTKNKICNKITDIFMEILVEKSLIKYFKDIINSFNKAIDSLEEISNNFTEKYNLLNNN